MQLTGEVRRSAAKGASRVRRQLLGLLLRVPGSGGGDPTSLLARFPDEAMLPLRRHGLDPVPALGELCAREPVSRLKMPFGLRGWLVTGYDEARAVLAADTDTFSNDFTNMIGKAGIAADKDPGGLGFTDAPQHTRLRKMLTAHFTVRALSAQEPRIRRIIDDALDEVAAAGADGRPLDLQEHFALAIPSRVIMEMIGVDEADRPTFHRLSTARFDFGDGAAAPLDLIQESIGFLREIVARQRRRPTGGLIADILAEHGADIDDVELAGLIDGVLTGGLETTVSMLSLGALVLLQRPDLADRLRAEDAFAEPFVEEVLRHLTVVQVGFPRFAVRDQRLGGQDVFAGDVVVCSLSGANRDARRTPDPTRVDPDRDAGGHLAFGHGVHRCVGAELARLELQLAYPALVRRFARLRLAVPADELHFRDTSIVYGLEALPVTL